MGCGQLFGQLTTTNKAIKAALETLSPETAEGLNTLIGMRNDLLKRIQQGSGLPRKASIIKLIVGLSPGLLRVWFDIETGWFTEGRPEPGSRPIYNHITEEQAMRLIGPNPDRDLAHKLMVTVPDNEFN